MQHVKRDTDINIKKNVRSMSDYVRLATEKHNEELRLVAETTGLITTDPFIEPFTAAVAAPDAARHTLFDVMPRFDIVDVADCLKFYNKS